MVQLTNACTGLAISCGDSLRSLNFDSGSR